MLWTDLEKLRPKNLKISPVAVVPQVGRRGRIILDLSFPVYQKDGHGIATIIQQSVNESTVLAGPKIPVKEIGKVLPRLLQYMKEVLPEHPVEKFMDVKPVPMRAQAEKPSRCLQVYVDDFCLAATQSMDGQHIPTISRNPQHTLSVSPTRSHKA